jgi:hypothetical protein
VSECSLKLISGVVSLSGIVLSVNVVGVAVLLLEHVSFIALMGDTQEVVMTRDLL